MILTASVTSAFPQEVLHKKSCDLPPELTGVSGHALMRYKVNPMGYVNYVESAYAQVEPPGRTQDLVAHLQGCLKQWKYRPGGELDILLGFHYFGPIQGTPEMSSLPDGRKVPLSHLQDLREAKLRFADHLLAGPDLREVTGQGWTLRTNVRSDEREALVSAIELADQSFQLAFPRRGGSGGQPVTVLVFGAVDPFRKVSAFDNLYVRFTPGGQYLPDERIAYTYASRRDAPLKISQQYVSHEVTHHFVHDRLAPSGRRTPYWIDEGIATYIELLRPPKKDKLDRFKFLRGRQKEGPFSWNARSEVYLESFERHAGHLPDPAHFLQGQFKDIDVELAYGLSWILVHYLINGEQGSLYEPFVTWMTQTMGTPGDPGLASALNRTPDQIFSALSTHAAAMKRGG
ncbi:MAG: hypothetical protein ACREAA_10980 [Candidatus Polarisedimenticolia bacterium]